MAIDTLPAGNQSNLAAIAPWSNIITLFPGGGNLANFFGLYQSQGTQTLVGANTIPTLLDGPEKVVIYDNLTLGDGVTSTSLSASQRHKGLCIAVKGNLTIRANATLHMMGKGARVLTNDDPFFPFVDFVIPNQITLSSSLISLSQALGVIRANGFAPWDVGLWQAVAQGIFGFNLAITQAGTVALLKASGCGAGAPYTSSVSQAGGAGINGGTGGGGGGFPNSAYVRPGRPGSPYGGGSASGASSQSGSYATSAYVNNLTDFPNHSSGPGGSAMDYDGTVPNLGSGAGNPPGNASGTGTQGGLGVGGKLAVIVAGLFTVQVGGIVDVDGMPGGAGTSGGGAGSGAGHLTIITPPGGYQNSGTVRANGGVGGAVGGGNGGLGSVVIKTTNDMGM